MRSEIKFIVTHHGQSIEQVKETSPEPAHLLKSLKEFQESVNATLTKLIENSGVSTDGADDQMHEDSDEDKEEEDNAQSSPKKRKK